MSLADMTAEGVRRALTEFDQLGRNAFLAKYKLGKAREYFLVDGGKRYDSKAIAGAGHGYSTVVRIAHLSCPPNFRAGSRQWLLGLSRWDSR